MSKNRLHYPGERNLSLSAMFFLHNRQFLANTCSINIYHAWIKNDSHLVTRETLLRYHGLKRGDTAVP